MTASEKFVILDPQKLRVRAASCFERSAACKGSAANSDKARRLRQVGGQFALWADELECDRKPAEADDAHRPSRPRSKLSGS
jgi:hypothetical protein